MEEKEIVFVCTGNTCRSPMAEAVFRSEIRRLRITGAAVSSAGIERSGNGTINRNSAAVLAENGLSIENFSPRLLERELLSSACAFICMTDSQRDMLMDIRWKILRESGIAEIENNVYSFSDIAGYEIPDPFGRDLEYYRLTYRKIAEGMSLIIAKFFPEESNAAQKVETQFTREFSYEAAITLSDTEKSDDLLERQSVALQPSTAKKTSSSKTASKKKSEGKKTEAEKGTDEKNAAKKPRPKPRKRVSHTAAGHATSSGSAKEAAEKTTKKATKKAEKRL